MNDLKPSNDLENTTAVFDTGMGGLSLISAIHSHDPTQKLCFFTDNGRFPYGDQTPEKATEWLTQIAVFLAQRGCKKLLLGCNTVTAMTERKLQGCSLPLKIEGPINATVDAITTHLRNELVLLFATDATLKTGAYQEKLAKNNIAVVPMNGNGLERVIEKEAPENSLVKQTAAEAVQEMSERIPETALHARIAVVLACTHFVLIEDLLREIFRKKGLLWKTFNPLPFIVEKLIGPPSHLKIQQGRLHILHTAAHSDEWWKSCSRFIPLDMRSTITRELVSLT
jgi:glutamate racemase